jgi:hypothetical protein
MGSGQKARPASAGMQSANDVAEIAAVAPRAKKKTVLEIPLKDHRPLGDYCPLSLVDSTKKRVPLHHDIYIQESGLDPAEDLHRLSMEIFATVSIESVPSGTDDSSAMEGAQDASMRCSQGLAWPNRGPEKEEKHMRNGRRTTSPASSKASSPERSHSHSHEPRYASKGRPQSGRNSSHS